MSDRFLRERTPDHLIADFHDSERLADEWGNVYWQNVYWQMVRLKFHSQPNRTVYGLNHFKTREETDRQPTRRTTITRCKTIT